MPQAPTFYMLLVNPTEGGDDDVWDTLDTARMLLLDAHDHSATKGKPVPVAGLDVDDDLPCGGNAIVDVGYVGLDNLAMSPGGARSVYVRGGDLWYRNASGGDVQVTSGNALTLTTAGGFAGDYSSAGAEAAYSDAADGYTFKQQTGVGRRHYARLNSADLRLYRFFANPDATAEPTNYVGLSSPAALAASYTLTLAAALPGAGTTKLWQVTSAGDVTFSSIIVDAVTLAAGAAVSAGQHITLGTGGRYKHGTMTVTVNGIDGVEVGGAGNWTYGSMYAVSGAAGILAVRVPLEVGQRVQSYSLSIYGNASADVTYEVNVYDSSMVKTTLSTATVTNPAAAWTPHAAGATHTMAAGEILVVEFNANASGIRVGAIEIGRDWP